MSENEKFTKHQFYFELPLYEPVNKSDAPSYLFSGDVDGYSSRNSFDTTYEISEREAVPIYGVWYRDGGYGVVTLKCKRKSNDQMRFFIMATKDMYVKVGQWPSLADIQFAEIGKKYDKHMDREDLKEFKKAIGLAAHGVGVGSFVYLRRIFGNLIQNAYDANKDIIGLKPVDFHKLRMAERVTVLAPHLPSQLVEMGALYSVLSKGVHELSEEECLGYFPALRLAVELILEQKIEQDVKALRDVAVKKELDSIAARLNAARKSEV